MELCLSMCLRQCMIVHAYVELCVDILRMHMVSIGFNFENKRRCMSSTAWSITNIVQYDTICIYKCFSDVWQDNRMQQEQNDMTKHDLHGYLDTRSAPKNCVLPHNLSTVVICLVYFNFQFSRYISRYRTASPLFGGHFFLIGVTTNSCWNSEGLYQHMFDYRESLKHPKTIET